MRTLGSEVARGRWGRSLSGGRLLAAFEGAGVAVLLCCPSTLAWRSQATGECRGSALWADRMRLDRDRAV